MILQIAILIIVMLGWTFYKVQTFLKKNQPKMAGLYSCLMGICTILGTFMLAHVDISSTTVPLNMIFQPIGKFFLKN
jgi:hypothetical protein